MRRALLVLAVAVSLLVLAFMALLSITNGYP